MDANENPKTTEQTPPISDEPIAQSPWHSSQEDHPVAHDTPVSAPSDADALPPIEEPDTPPAPAVVPAAPNNWHAQPAMQQSQPIGKPKRTFGQKIKAMLKSPKFWMGLVGFVILGLVIAWFVQPSRWWLANIFAPKNTITITTITPAVGDAKASQLRNVAINVNGQTYKTNDKGQVQVAGVPYGPVSVKAEKAGFQTMNYGVTLDVDPFFYAFGGKAADDAARTIELSMQATGIPVAFKAVDYLSGKPITNGEFAVSDVVAKPDKNGLVSLKVPGTDASKVTVSASFGGSYIDKKFDVTLSNANNPDVTFVPAGKHYFVSKRDGVLTVYGSNLDGSEVQPIVVGTGQETDQTAFAVSPDGKYGVLSSSRDGARDNKKNLLQRVYVVDLLTKQIARVDEGATVTYADWAGDKLVYTTTNYDASSNTYPSTLRSIDAATKRVYNFETADYISVSTVGSDKVLYLKYSSSGDQQSVSPVLRQAPMNATTMKTLGEQVSYDSYIQLDFDRIAFKTGQDQAWHEYSLTSDSLKTISQPGSGSTTVRYLSTANTDGSKRLIIDQVDGKYTLFMKDATTGAETKLYGAAGLGGPIRWIGNAIVFRVVTSDQTADYAVSVNGGEAKKITDVTATASTQGAVTENRFKLY